jgi:hypothetical protein
MKLKLAPKLNQAVPQSKPLLKPGRASSMFRTAPKFQNLRNITGNNPKPLQSAGQPSPVAPATPASPAISAQPAMPDQLKNKTQAPQAPLAQSVGPAQQDQQMRDQLIKQPQQAQPQQQSQTSQQEAAPQDNSAIDQQIAALQQQIEQLKSQKK